MKKKVFISILTVTVLCIWAINASAKGNPVKKLKVKDAKVVFCEAIPATMNGVCEVTTGDNSLLIKGNILSIHTVYRGGEVLVDASGGVPRRVADEYDSGIAIGRNVVNGAQDQFPVVAVQAQGGFVQ